MKSWKVGKFTCDGKVYSFYICKSWCLSSVWYPTSSSLLLLILESNCVKTVWNTLFIKFITKDQNLPAPDIHLVQNSIRVPSLPYASSCFFAMLYCVSLNNYFKKSPPPSPLSSISYLTCFNCLPILRTKIMYGSQCSPYQAVTNQIYLFKQHFLPPATAWSVTKIKQVVSKIRKLWSKPIRIRSGSKYRKTKSIHSYSLWLLYLNVDCQYLSKHCRLTIFCGLLSWF